jgi:hypothetical protein
MATSTLLEGLEEKKQRKLNSKESLSKEKERTLTYF